MTKVDYRTSPGLISYSDAMRQMDAIVSGVQSKATANTVWFLEHQHVYTTGARVNEGDRLKLDMCDVPVYQSNRGGQFTYHGPGQRIVYLMLNLKEIFRTHNPDIREYIFLLEECIIKLLQDLNLKAVRSNGHRGVWVQVSPKEELKKIAFLGINLKKFVTSHGISFNLDPDLRYFEGIVPCGIKGCHITSLQGLGISISMHQFDLMFKKKLEEFFNFSS